MSPVLEGRFFLSFFLSFFSFFFISWRLITILWWDLSFFFYLFFIGKRIPNHWTTKEALSVFLLKKEDKGLSGPVVKTPGS